MRKGGIICLPGWSEDISLSKNNVSIYLLEAPMTENQTHASKHNL
jgi:hypothetical protein